MTARGNGALARANVPVDRRSAIQAPSARSEDHVGRVDRGPPADGRARSAAEAREVSPRATYTSTDAVSGQERPSASNAIGSSASGTAAIALPLPSATATAMFTAAAAATNPARRHCLGSPAPMEIEASRTTG